MSKAFASCRKMLRWLRIATLLACARCSAPERALVSNIPLILSESRRPADLVAPSVPLLTCYAFPARLWDGIDESRKQRPAVDDGWEVSCGSGGRKRLRAGGREACRRDQPQETCRREPAGQQGKFSGGEEPRRRAEGAVGLCGIIGAESRVRNAQSW